MIDNRQRLEGSFVALVTPMHTDGSLDFQSLEQLVERHIAEGTNAIVAVGTTGESATLTIEEHLRVIERVVQQSNGRIPVVAGTGANSTREALELTRAAQGAGVDACLLVVPYYNKPTQEGLYRHFMTIADGVAIDQILYNVPNRTITDLENATVLRLANQQNIIGVKDATGDMVRGRELIEQVPEGFKVYSGDDPTAYTLMSMGGKGNISVTANVAPGLMAELCRLAMTGQGEAARDLQDRLMPLHRSLFTQSNPIPVKWALAAMGLIPEGIRLPLTPLSADYQEPLRQALRSLSLPA